MGDCPATTKRRTPCPINGEEERGGFCHVHDPKGKSYQHYQYQARTCSRCGQAISGQNAHYPTATSRRPKCRACYSKRLGREV